MLTEQRKFLGSLDDLRAVRDTVAVPVLRKEFIAEEYQLLEARACGADLALLIVAGLDQSTLARLAEFTEQLGMTALVEAHDRDEALRAVDAGARVVGVNTRNLKTLEVDRATFDTVIRQCGSALDHVVRVAESGVRGPHDVLDYARSGADAVLVGEALVTQGTPRQAVADMVAAANHPSVRSVLR